MITIFYEAYPNEITYSWFARYSHINGDITYTTTSKELFGKKRVKPIILYPKHIGYFIKQLPTEWNITISEIINKNTIIPLFLPFMDKERADNIISHIKDGDMKNIALEIGINTGQIFKEEPNIKVCPICYKEDIEKHGEAYIHRNYQVPGTYICSSHGEHLYKYSIPSNLYEYEYVDINKISNNCLSRINFIEDFKNVYLKLSQEISYILNGNLKDYDIELVKQKYKDKLEEEGYLKKGGIIPIKSLTKKFNKFYPKELLVHLESYVDEKYTKNWIKVMLTNSGRYVHPIRHLLFITFLFGGIKEFIDYKKNFEPFGKPPWLCLNPVCKFYKKPVINKVIFKNTKKPTGIFTCNCGFSYSRIGPDKNEIDKNRIGKLESFGWYWEEVLIKLVEEGCSITAITKKMKSDTKTILKQAMKLGVIDKLNTKRRIKYKGIEKRISEDMLWEYKNKILLFIKENPTCNRMNVRDALSKEYDLLYIRDNEWLNNNLPKPREKSQYAKIKRDINWKEREKKLIPLLLSSIEEIKNEEKPRRITKTYLMKKINKIMFLENRYLEKMPLVKNFLDSNCESVDDFNKRKNMKITKIE